MSFSIVVSEFAQMDIDDATKYYEVKRQGLGRLFLLSVKDTFSLIAQNPLMYVKIYKEIRRALTKKFPYAIFYRIDKKAKEVTIYRILSSYRNPNLWKQSIDDIK